MDAIKAFKTADGAIFEDREIAARHEEFLRNADVIEQFLDSDDNPYRGPQRIVARNSIINWNLWRSRNVEC